MGPLCFIIVKKETGHAEKHADPSEPCRHLLTTLRVISGSCSLTFHKRGSTSSMIWALSRRSSVFSTHASTFSTIFRSPVFFSYTSFVLGSTIRRMAVSSRYSATFVTAISAALCRHDKQTNYVAWQLSHKGAKNLRHLMCYNSKIMLYNTVVSIYTTYSNIKILTIFSIQCACKQR